MYRHVRFASLSRGGVSIALTLIALAAMASSSRAVDVNIARLGVASQSTTAFGGDALRANDGNISSGDYTANGTTSHTDNGVNSLWQVDLGSPFDLSRVDLFARSDCCPNRLANFHLRVLDAPGGNTVYEQLVASDITQNTVGSFPLPAGTTGQVVQVQFNGLNNDNNGFLSLREVRVFGDYPVVPGSNVAALFGVVSQSSTDFGGFAGRVIDGNTDGVYANGSVAHTALQAAPSLTIDLGSEFFVDDVVLSNRSDFLPQFNCCLGRTRDVSVELLAADGTTVVASSPLLNPDNVLGGGVGDGAGGPLTLDHDFGHQAGQFVRVRINTPGDSFLHLAEVEVFGAAVPEPSSFVLAGLGVAALAVARIRAAWRRSR